MKHIYLLLLVLPVFATGALGQMTLPFSDDFETYTSGTGLASQADANIWTTWSGATGGAEEAQVSNQQVSNGSNAMYINGSNDMVLLTNDLTQGVIETTFNIYVPAGKVGYFNVLQKFDGANSHWAFDVFFKSGGQGAVSAYTGSDFNYTPDAWQKVKVIVDLDSDWGVIFINDEVVHEFRYSYGSQGNNNKTFAAVNFYAWNNNGDNTPGYYIDEIAIQQIQTPAPPLNFQATIEQANDVVLTWEAPESGTPGSYSVYRGMEKIADGLTELSFTDEAVYPSNYTYAVRAFADGKYSTPVETNVAFEGVVPRKTVLFEVGTGTWCQYCPGIARAMDSLHENGQDVSIIEYHYNDSYETTESLQRNSYYSINTYPTTVGDGKLVYSGGSRAGNLYPNVLNMYNQLVDVPSVIDINMTLTRTGEKTYQAKINASEVFKYYTSGLKLRVALTESHISKYWQGMTEVNFVMRDMMENAAGLDLDFSSDPNHEVTLDFELDDSFVAENCRLVAFVQHDGSSEVAQAVTSLLPTQMVGFDKSKGDAEVSVFPNPVNNHLFIRGVDTADKIEIRSISGQLIYSGAGSDIITSGFNTSGLLPGTYTLLIYRNKQINVLRFVK